MKEDNDIILKMLLVMIIGFLFVLSFSINKTNHISEGMIMNKFISQEYNNNSIKYILAIQNGENKEWWFVDKEYYNNISIGNWVKK